MRFLLLSKALAAARHLTSHYSAADDKKKRDDVKKPSFQTKLFQSICLNLASLAVVIAVPDIEHITQIVGATFVTIVCYRAHLANNPLLSQMHPVRLRKRVPFLVLRAFFMFRPKRILCIVLQGA